MATQTNNALGKQTQKLKKLVTWITLVFYLGQPAFGFANAAVADPNAPGKNRPVIERTANGLPLVQITTPSAAGVSRNLYKEFHVGPQGLILNNAQGITRTQLAGYVPGNPYLAKNTAKIILNEVTGPNSSQLRGYTEVAGRRAEVVIANPNGISGDGFGFINTSRVLLTTGTPVFGANGSLDAFRVAGGQIAIEGQGFDASNIDKVDLISRTVTANAGIWANELTVITGTNTVDYNTLNTEKITGDAQSQVAIDVGVLGGMYANKIKLIGTERGVGVNSQGSIVASGGDLILTNEGKVILAGSTSAAGNVTIKALDDVSNKGTIFAQGKADINTIGALSNAGVLAAAQDTSVSAKRVSSTGTIGAGIRSDGSVGNTGDLTVTAAGAVAVTGQNLAGGNLVVTGTGIDASGAATYAGGNIAFIATAGDVNNSGATLEAAGSFTATSQGAIHNDQSTILAEKLTLTAADVSNRSGKLTQFGTNTTTIKAINTIDNTGGQISTLANSLQIQANTLTNSQGKIEHAGTETLTIAVVRQLKTDNGKIASNGDVALSAASIDNTGGTVVSQKRLSATVQGDLANNQGTLASVDTMNVIAQGAITNTKGSIEAGQGLVLQADSVTNGPAGRIVSLGNSGLQITAGSDIQNSGLIGGNGTVNLAGKTLVNQNGQITAQHELAINTVTGIDNTGGTIFGSQNVALTTGQITNRGTIAAGNNAIITANNLASTGTIGSGITSDGSFNPTGDLTIKTTNTAAITGQNLVAGSLTVEAAAITTAGSTTYAGQAINLNALSGDIDNTGGILSASGKLALTAKGAIHNDKNANNTAGEIKADQVALTADTITNRGGGIVQFGQNDTAISAVHQIDNTSGAISTNANTSKIQAGTLSNSQGKIEHAGSETLTIAVAGQLTTDKGNIASNGNVVVSAAGIDNTRGTVFAQKRLNLALQGDLANNQGVLSSADAMTITAQGAITNEAGSIEAAKGLEVTAQAVNNQQGRLVSLDASGMKIRVAQELQNQSGLIGSNGNVDIAAQNLGNQSGQITAKGNLAINAAQGMDSNLAADAVRNDGAIASGGDLTLTSSRKMLLSGSTSANGNILVNAQGGVNNYSTLYAKGNTNINTASLENSGALLSGQNTSINAQTVTSTGTLGAGVNNDGTLGNGGDIAIQATGAVRAQGQTMAAGNLTISGTSIDLVNSKNYAGANASLTATVGGIDHSSGTLQVDGVLNATAQGAINNDNGAINARKLAFTANSISNRSGKLTQFGQEASSFSVVTSIDNTNGAILTNGESLTIQAGSLLNNQGQIQHAGTGLLAVTTASAVTNAQGLLAGNGQLSFSATTIDNSQGTMVAKGIDLTAQSALVNNRGTISASTNAIRITAQGAITNEQGSIEAAKGLEMTAQAVNNRQGRIVSLDASGMKITAAQELQNQSGLIGSNADVNLTAQSLVNTSGKIIAQGSINADISQTIDNTSGSIVAQQSVVLGQRDATINNTLQGNITAGTTIAIKANQFDNSAGSMIANQDIAINTGSMTAGGTAVAGQDLNLTVAGSFTHGADGDFRANRDITIAADRFTNKGNISAVRNITLTVNNAANDSGAKLIGNAAVKLHSTGNVSNSGLIAGSTTQINAQNITNSGSLSADTAIIVADTISNTGNTAVITTSQSADFTAKTAFNNTSGANIYTFGNNDTALTIKTVALNNSGVIASGGNTAIEAQTISSSGSLAAGIHSDGSFKATGDLILTAKDALLATGNNLAAGTFIANAQDINLTGAKTVVGKDIQLTAATGDIDNTGAVLQAKGIVTLQAGKTLHNDKNATGAAASIYGNKITINAATISNIGGNITQVGAEDTNITATTNMDNTSGAIVTNGKNLTILTDTLTGSQSNIIHAGSGDMNITATASMSNNNGAVIQSNGNVTISTGAFTNTKGIVTALQGIGITSNTLNNNQGTLAASGGVSINLQNELNNQNGIVEAGKALIINAQSVANQGGSLSSLDASGMTVRATQSINNTSGTIGSNGDVNLIAPTLVNAAGKVLAQGSITAISDTITNTGGTIAAQQNVTAGKAGTNITNTAGGSISAGKNLLLQADTLTSTDGKMAANQDVAISANTITGIGNITAGRDLSLALTSDFIHPVDGKIMANRDFNLTTANFTNLGSLAAVRNLTINAANVTNQANANLQGGAGLQITATGNVTNSGNLEGNTVSISGKSVVNTGSVFGDTLALTADTISNSGDAAIIAATKNINLFAKSSVENKDGATIYSMGNINIAGDQNQGANGAYTDWTGSVLNQSATIEAIGNIGIFAKKIVNKKREFLTEQQVVSDVIYSESKQGSPIDEKTAVALTPLVREACAKATFLLGEMITETKVTKDSPQGKILSGGNMFLHAGTVTNEFSSILAGSVLNTSEVGEINNIASGYVRTITRHLIDGFYIPKIHGGFDIWLPGSLYDDTVNEQLLSNQTSLFGGGQQVIIQGGTINNTTVTPSGVPVGTQNNIASSGKNQAAASAQANSTSQTAAIQTISGNVAASSSSVPISNMQTLLPTGQNQGTVSGQTNSNTSSQAVTMSVGAVSGVTSTTQNQGAVFGQTNGNSSSKTTTIQMNSNTQTSSSSEQNQGVGAVGQTLHGNTIALPTNGMFTIHQEPNSKYLVETNSRFTSYSNFVSSDYMLQKLNIDPAVTMKRLGDGFYEQKLVREQITELTGRVYLTGYDSAETQYKALLESGATYAQKFSLQVGVALSAEQMAQLTTDIVWMVEKEVDGQRVLVPEVYLSRVRNSDLKATGAVIAADRVQINASGDLTNAGVIKANESVQIHAANIANYGGTIDGGASTQLTAEQDLLNFSGLLSGEKIALTAGNDFKNETLSFTSTSSFLSRTTTGNIAKIDAGQTLSIQAGRDISITGAQVNAGQDIAMNAGHNLTVDSVQQEQRVSTGNYLKDNVSNVVSNISAGNNVSLTTVGDATLRGAQVSAGGKLALLAGGNITLAAVKDEQIEDKTVGIRHGWRRTMTDDETVIGSTLQGGGQVTVAAVQLPGGASGLQQDRGNVTIAGSTIISKTGGVTIAADKDVTVEAVTEKHESLVISHTKKKGTFSSKTTDTRDHTLVNEVVGSTVSGEAVTVQSGADLTVKASNLVATNDLSLTAGNNLNLTSAAETGVEDHYKKTKKSGLFGGGGLGFTIGSKSEKSTIKEQTLGEVGSTIGSLQGNVSLLAGNQVTSQGTTMVSAKDLNITAKAVTIDNTINTYDSQSKYEVKQSGLSVSLGGGAVGHALSAVGNAERAKAVEDDRLKALYTYKAVKDVNEVIKAKGDLTKGVAVSVSLGSSKQTSEQTVHTETVNTSNINAGGAVRVIATAGDVTLTGVKLNAGGVAIQAAKDINLNAAQNKQQIDTKTSSSSWSVGAGINTGYTAGVSKGSGKEHENSVANVGSVINASGTVALQSGSDTNINGSQVKGDKVVANIGGNLNISSLQDINDYTAKNKNSGIELSTGIKTGTTGSIGSGKTNSTYASVTEQAGIFAGTGGFDLTVGKNTDLKGAVIASEATSDKNKLSTDTLTFSDVNNKAEYKASSNGVNYAAGKDANGKEVAAKDSGFTPNPGMPASGEADSTTKSAISPGTIEVRSGNTAALEKLSRDTTNSLNALQTIFDKKTVQEKQELAKLFGEVAYEQVHILAANEKAAAQKKYDDAKKNGAPPAELKSLQANVDAWGESGINKIALHATVGGLMSEMGGSGFASGAVGAGINEAAQIVLSNIKDPGLHQIVSALLGAAAAKVVGGDAQAGASTAASGTKNNYYAFAFYKDELKDKVKEVLGNGEKAQAINDAIERELNPNDDEPPTPANEVVAAENIKEILSKNGITGAQANLIVMYYLQKADETFAATDPLYKQGGKACLDLAFNAGLIVAGVGELKALYELGRLSYLTYRIQSGYLGASNVAWKGSGPVPGVLGVNSSSESVAAIKNYYPKEGIEFVFDPKTNTFLVGKPQQGVFTGSAHQQLSRSIAADESIVLGGTFQRGPNGEIITNEFSGHYGERWTPQLRQQFEEIMEKYGLKVIHEAWGN